MTNMNYPFVYFMGVVIELCLEQGVVLSEGVALFEDECPFGGGAWRKYICKLCLV